MIDCCLHQKPLHELTSEEIAQIVLSMSKAYHAYAEIFADNEISGLIIDKNTKEEFQEGMKELGVKSMHISVLWEKFTSLKR